MAEGRGGAMVAMKVICLLAVALQCEAASFVVGDSTGWTMKFAAGWGKGKGKGKTFKAGDKLVFNYTKGKQNVVVVNKAGYNGCTTTPSTRCTQVEKMKLALRRVLTTSFVVFLVIVLR